MCQIKVVLNKIEKYNFVMEQVLFNVISINFDINGKFVIEVSELVLKLVCIVWLEKEEIKQVCYVGFICEFGLLGFESEDFKVLFLKFKY